MKEGIMKPYPASKIRLIYIIHQNKKISIFFQKNGHFFEKNDFYKPLSRGLMPMKMAVHDFSDFFQKIISGQSFQLGTQIGIIFVFEHIDSIIDNA
jgi:hypothetical protein